MKRGTYILIVFFLACLSVLGQAKRITGLVKDKSGPLPGVSVSEKGNPSNGVSTDANGKFTLTLKKSHIIVLSSIGYVRQEVSVEGLASVVVEMKDDSKSLDEVVVVGYGQKKKVTLTGAVSAVSGKDIRQSPSPSLQNTLAGRLTGFTSQQRGGQPGKDAASFNIRGVSSYVGNNNPLILVDDIEFTYNEFASLSASEVESITVLKDASTTAIYGIKGANGVVLVTTTRGKAGKPRITLQSEYGLSQPTRLPDYLDSYGAASLLREAQINTNNLNPNKDFKPTFSEEDLELFRNGTDPYGHPNNNWRDLLFNKFAPQARTNFDLNGGTDKVKYFVSVGYLYQGGQLKDYSVDLNSKYYYKRYNYRSNIDLAVNKSLDLRFDLFGNLGETNQNNASVDNAGVMFADLGRAYDTAPYNYPIYNPDGSLGYSVWQRTATGRNKNNLIGRLMYNGYTRNFANNINLVTSANQKLDFLVKGLSVKAVLSYRNLYGYERSMQRPIDGSGFVSYVYDPGTDTYSFGMKDDSYRISTPYMQYSAGSTNRSVTVQGMLNYNRYFGSHHLSGLLLYNLNSKTAQSSNSEYNFIPENFRGYTGRFGYDYNQRYLFEVSGAYNGTDRFAKGHRMGFFPSASAGWNISEEGFFKDHVRFIDRLKFRASYGLVGVDNTGGVYAYKQSYTSGSGTGLFGLATNNSYSTVTEGPLANEVVTWEKEKKLNIGVDFAAFRQRLTGTLDWFNNNRYDIISTPGTISSVLGQDLPKFNLGKTNNKGYEIELAYNDKIGASWQYSVKGTWSVAKNKILFRDEAPTIYPWQAVTGQSIGAAMKYSWTGEFYTEAEIADPSVPKPSVGGRPGEMKYKDLNGDGVIDLYDRSYFGYTNLPNTVYGLTFGVGYKNLNLTLLFQGAANVVASAQGAVIHHVTTNMMPIHQEHWTPERGNSAKYPQLYTSALSTSPRDYYSDFWAIPSDYIRLKTAELSYSFGAKFLNKTHLKGLRIYTNGYNLFTWTKLDKLYDLDPELNEGSDSLPYPPSRIMNFGINVTF